MKVWCSWGFSSDFAGKNGRGDDEECTGGTVREKSVCMCVVLTEKEKEKERKSESDRPKKEKREWIVWWVVGLGGEHVGTKQSDLFLKKKTDGTLQFNFLRPLYK